MLYMGHEMLGLLLSRQKIYLLSHTTQHEPMACMQVRGLQSSGWQKDAQQFQAYGEVVAKYVTAQMEGVLSSELSKRDLSAVRMLLRGLLKQAEERYEETSIFVELQGKLDKVAALEKE